MKRSKREMVITLLFMGFVTNIGVYRTDIVSKLAMGDIIHWTMAMLELFPVHRPLRPLVDRKFASPYQQERL